MRFRSDAKRVAGGIQVTLHQDFNGSIHWWRWKVLPSGKVAYVDEGGPIPIEYDP